MSYVGHSWNVIEVYPLTVLARNYALCAEHDTVGRLVGQSLESGSYSLDSVRAGSLGAPAGEHLVGVVMMMLVVVVMVMVVTAAGAVGTVVVVVLVFMVVMMLMLMVVVMVMMMFVLVLMVMLVIIVVVMMMLMVVVSFVEQCLELVAERVLLRHSVNELTARELVPLGSYHGSLLVEPANELNSLAELLLRETRGMAEDNAACVLYLIVEEFAEILVVHLALLGVNDRSEAVELNVVSVDVAYSVDDVAELAYARGLDEDAVGVVLVKHLHESLAEVTDE